MMKVHANSSKDNDVLSFMFILVLRVQFASTLYSGLESSGEILVSIKIVGGIPTVNISVNVEFSEATATG